MYQDDEIWESFKNGERSALALIFENNFKSLYNYGMRFCAKQELVEDAIQDLFTELWDRRKKLGKIKSIRFYLLSSFRRRLLILTKQNRRKQASINDMDIGDQVFLFQPSYEHQIISMQVEKERSDKLQTIIKSLSPRQQEAIYLKYRENLSYDQTAKVLGITRKAAYKILARAISNMRASWHTAGWAASFYIEFKN